MAQPTHEQIMASRRATERAKAVLRAGDKLRIKRCGDIRSTVTMLGWCEPPYDRWIYSATLNDISAGHILKVNGKPVDFGKED